MDESLWHTEINGILMVITGTTTSVLSLRRWGRDKMASISQTTFSRAFSWVKMIDFWLKFHWSLFLRVWSTIFQHWFRQWLGTYRPGDKPLSESMMVCFTDTYIQYTSLGLNELSQTRQIRTPVLRIPPAVTSQAKMKNWLHECQKWVSHMIGHYAHI